MHAIKVPPRHLHRVDSTLRLLIADDDPSLRIALQLVFEQAGHQVFPAESAAEVRATLSTVPVDAVLLDAGLREGGIELWQELEADESLRGRALLLTGNLPALGPLRDHDRVLGKPFDYDALLERVEALGSRASSAR